MNEFANAEHNRMLKANNGNAGYALMDACEQIADLTDQVDELKALLADALDKKRWIPVEERLHPYSEEVLVIDEDGRQWLAVYTPEECVWFDTSVLAKERHNITHWRPLPEPPGEERG